MILALTGLHAFKSYNLLPFNLNFAENYFKFILYFSVIFLHKNCKNLKVHAERIVLMQFYHILTFANYHFPVQSYPRAEMLPTSTNQKQGPSLAPIKTE